MKPKNLLRESKPGDLGQSQVLETNGVWIEKIMEKTFSAVEKVILLSNVFFPLKSEPAGRFNYLATQFNQSRQRKIIS